MRILHTISKSAFEAYRCSLQTILIPREQRRTIRPEGETWNDAVVPEIKVLALRVLVGRWKEYPFMEKLPTYVDRDMLLEMLPMDLPFELIIKKIPDGYYWKRIAKNRWEYNNPKDHGNSWRQLYCERYFAEYLERLEPTYFQQETCNELIELIRDYINILRIRSLVPNKFPSKRLMKEKEEEKQDRRMIQASRVDHILMNAILPKFPHLRELYINFGMIYMNDGFEWRDFQFSMEDCENLGRGIKDCEHLKRFSLTRSNMDQHRVAALLQGIVLNNMIEEINFSHCKLGDAGAHLIGEFLTMHKSLKLLHLVNNKIGPSGVSGIVYGLLQENSTPLKYLNLRLNPLLDAGGVHICTLLLRYTNLEMLNISGCSLTTETGIRMAELIASGSLKLLNLNLDMSNNDFGMIAGEAFAMAMKLCSTIVGLDIRMCNFSKESEYFIGESIARNKTERKKNQPRMFLNSYSNVTDFVCFKNLHPSSEFANLQYSAIGTRFHGDSSFQDEQFLESREAVYELKEFSELKNSATTESNLKIGGMRSMNIPISESKTGLKMTSSRTIQKSAAELIENKSGSNSQHVMDAKS